MDPIAYPLAVKAPPNLETPAVIVDRQILQANIGAMQQVARQADLNLRPHIKTHKSITIARQQMAAGAVGPFFISADLNRSHNYNPRLDDPAVILIHGVRTGPIFRFKNRPDMNVSLWAGYMFSSFNGDTDGSIDVVELAPDAPGRIDEMQGDLDNWYAGLSPVEQALF